ncbi:transcriptional regulator [Pseudonocardia sp. MH-G8]|nr:transcriptional regulator [Pseudonocardia sp. MH-G8]
MHSRETVDRVLALCRPGVTTRELAKLTGLPESTIAHWRRGDRRGPGVRSSRRCPRCDEGTLVDSYAYLLGAYLGDGHITWHRRGVQALSVSCADDWPKIMDDVEAAMREVLASSVCRVRRPGCMEIKAYSTHWVCLFPQHGPGRKHTRPITLEHWQQELVERHTAAFLRGLFHSDGCRITNWATRTVDGRTTRHEYPRWFFSNESADILGLCSAGLDRLGIAHRFPRYNTISVARREAVAALDEAVGPKA